MQRPIHPRTVRRRIRIHPVRYLAAILLAALMLLAGNRSLAQGVSINEKNITLEKVFRRITKQTGYLFFYTDEMMKQAPKLDLHISNATLDQTMEVCLQNLPLSYSILGKTIILKMKAPHALDLSTQTHELARITIHGAVTDSKGIPLPGASIRISGLSTGTSADNEGRFSMELNENASIIFSYIGFVSQTIKVNGRNEINISLEENNKGLGEIVIVAYGSIKKADVTGSVVTVKTAQIEDKPFTSADKALQGAVAGLQSVASSGTPGAAQDIRIRGIGSFSGANPLWVIDGVIINTGDLSTNTTTSNALSGLNPDDIESMSILKDASATAIYGSRGANGVILVTTKRGRQGKTQFNFTTEDGWNSRAYQSSVKPMNADQYFGFLKQAFVNTGLTPDSAITILTQTYNYGRGINTDWLKILSRTASQGLYNLSMSGGNDKTTIYASGGYFSQEGTTLASSFKRWNGDLSITHKATDHFTVSTSLNGSYVAQHTPSNGGTFSNPVGAAYFLVPSFSPRQANGAWNYNTPEFPQTATFNPFAVDSLNYNKLGLTTLRGFLSGEYRILNNLRLTSRFGAEYVVLQENNYQSPVYGNGAATLGDAYSNNLTVFNWTWTNVADYRQKLNRDDDLYFNLKLGYEAQLNQTFTLIAEGQNLPNAPGLTTAAVASSPVNVSALPTANSTKSVFSIGDINYKDRYVLSGSFRSDNSSKFGVNRKTGNFYSVGVSWNLNNEAFLKDLDLINVLKLRSSYGETGSSAAIQNYEALSTYAYGNFLYNEIQYGYNYNQQPGSAPFYVGNPNLTWEKNKPFNIGVDFAILHNRLTGTLEYYSRKTIGLLQDVPLSATSGFATQAQNVGNMVNKGVEITLGGTLIQTHDLSWTLSGNISHNQNTILSLYQGQSIANGYFNYTVGHDLQSFYLTQWAGVDPATGSPLWYTDGTRKATTSNYTAAQMALNHSAAPKYFGGLSTNVDYKGIILQADLYYTIGNYVYDIWSHYLSGDGYIPGINEYNTETKAWQKPGDLTNVPEIKAGGNQNSNARSTRFLYKGDYMRLRNIQLGYNLPKALVQQAHLSSVNIYLRGTNLLTFVKDKNLPYDPEAGINGNLNLEVYIPKTITAGVKIGF